MKNLTIKIGEKIVISLKNNTTTLRNVRTVINAHIQIFGLEKKNLQITLPSGSVISYRDLNNVRAFARILFPAEFLTAEIDSVFAEQIREIQKVAYKLPLNWELVGSKDTKKILAIYKQATSVATEQGLIKGELTPLLK
ncbi:MAG: hypothetical protein LBM02_09720 [Lachnospiraceae bacterium]|jgi:hypothetical protein|nr:hypothetical protein [Lachnospiraceae bacterium]